MPASDLEVTNRLRRVAHNADGLLELIQVEMAAVRGCLYVRVYISRSHLDLNLSTHEIPSHWI